MEAVPFQENDKTIPPMVSLQPTAPTSSKTANVVIDAAALGRAIKQSEEPINADLADRYLGLMAAVEEQAVDHKDVREDVRATALAALHQTLDVLTEKTNGDTQKQRAATPSIRSTNTWRREAIRAQNSAAAKTAKGSVLSETWVKTTANEHLARISAQTGMRVTEADRQHFTGRMRRAA